MTASLYDLSVPTFMQTMRAIGGFLGRAAAHCAETGADADDFVNVRLFDDMAPFHSRSKPHGIMRCARITGRRKRRGLSRTTARQVTLNDATSPAEGSRARNDA
jgi:hypothetical protein